jgi:hypothetical protein
VYYNRLLLTEGGEPVREAVTGVQGRATGSYAAGASTDASAEELTCTCAGSVTVSSPSRSNSQRALISSAR